MPSLRQRVQVIDADITTLEVDAIVNAANSSLLGGGGVDGAIHRKAGPQLLAACRPLNGCKTGQVKMTEGFNLPARYVLHAVGPVWHGGRQNEPELLASCYRESLRLCRAHDLRTVAFPSISTGVYRFPAAKAAQIAVATVLDALAAHALPERVTLCAFGESARLTLQRALDEALPPEGA